jgi:hypothetical protein
LIKPCVAWVAAPFRIKLEKSPGACDSVSSKDEFSSEGYSFKVKMTMNDIPEARQWIGIDVSKRYLDVYIRPLGQALQVANSELGLIELHQHLDSLVIGLIALEATGGYQTLAARTLMVIAQLG